MSWGDWGTSEDLAYEEEVEAAYADECERDAEEEWAAKQAIKQADFDLALDAYQERERELADERAELGDRQATRPNAERFTITFGTLQIGDFMTAEEGPSARWVEVVDIREIEVADDEEDPGPECVSIKLSVTFRTPQPLGVGYHDRWVIRRFPSDFVVIDRTMRGDNIGG